MASELPPCRLLIRSKDRASIFYVVADKTPAGSTQPSLVPSNVAPVANATIHACSPDGTRVLFRTQAHGVVVRNVESGDDSGGGGEVPFLADSKTVQQIAFSPLGTYVVTWERPGKAEENSGSPPPNMKVWDGTTGAYIHGFHLKAIKRESWPNLRWTADEKYAFHLVTNELRIYNGNEITSPAVAKVRCNGITSFTLAPVDPSSPTPGKYLFSTFVPEVKGKPAKIAILRYPDRLGVDSKSAPMISGKSFYQAEEITVKWSPKGDSALVLTHTTVDSSGESYYGSTHLNLLPCGPTATGNDSVSVPLPNGGPVMDCQWCPDPSKPPCFVVISGKMPAMASLHHGSSADAIFLFGNAHRNTIVWSPSGRFICLAGFGNLAGGMDFWDRNKLKKMSQYNADGQVSYGNTAKAAACAFGWSPDSRAFHVSTTSPRMNVDNGVRLYKYNGFGPTCDFTEDLLPDKLLAAEFLPAKRGVVYPDRPQSPPPKDFKGRNEGPEDEASTAAPVKAAVITPAAPTVKAYVPPSARRGGGSGGGGGGSLAARMRAEREGNTVGATKVQKKAGVPGLSTSTGGVVGAAAPEKKSKNALRREKQRLKKQQQQQEEEMLTKAKAQQEQEAKATAASDPVDPAKRAKKINKLLKQIDELKGKDPSTLNEDQIKKMGTEAALREELSKIKL